jgi:hypothetical protein
MLTDLVPIAWKEKTASPPWLSLCTHNRIPASLFAHVRSRDNACEVGISNKRGVLNVMIATASAFVNEIHPQ